MRRRAHDKHAGQHHARVGVAFGQTQVGWDLGGQPPPLFAHRRHHHLRAAIEPRARVVEGVDGGAGLEVQVAAPVDAFEQVAKKPGHVARAQAGIVVLGDDEQVLGQRELPLAEDGVGLGEQLVPARCAR